MICMEQYLKNEDELDNGFILGNYNPWNFVYGWYTVLGLIARAVKRWPVKS